MYPENVMNHIFLSLMCNIGMIWQALKKSTDALLTIYRFKHNDKNEYVNYTHAQLDFVWDNSGEPVSEETFTHSHLSWSSVVPYLLHPSIMIHSILPVQFTCLTSLSTISLQVFFCLPLGLAPSTSHSIHFTITLLNLPSLTNCMSNDKYCVKL